MQSIFTHQELEDFRAIWKEEFNKEISLDRAQAEAESLLRTVYDMRKIYLRSLRKSKQDTADKST